MSIPQRPYAMDPVALARALGVDKEERDLLLFGAEHGGDFRCKICEEWWKLMGPDPETGTCGLFTMEEIGLDPEDYAHELEENE